MIKLEWFNPDYLSRPWQEPTEADLKMKDVSKALSGDFYWKVDPKTGELRLWKGIASEKTVPNLEKSIVKVLEVMNATQEQIDTTKQRIQAALQGQEE